MIEINSYRFNKDHNHNDNKATVYKRKYIMLMKLIDLEAWDRKEYFDHFIN